MKTFRLKKDIKRRLEHLKKGKFVVVIGVDGSGKSSIVKETLLYLKNMGISVSTSHWRPGLLPKLSVLIGRKNAVDFDTSSPRPVTKYGKLISILRLLYYFVDFIIGYLVKIRPLVNDGGIYVIERYFYDTYLDPERYGIKLSPDSKILKIMLKLVPKPDVLIYLKCSPDTAYIRKKEYSKNYIKNMIRKYDEFIQREKSKGIYVAVIETENRTIEESVKEVLEVILTNDLL